MQGPGSQLHVWLMPFQTLVFRIPALYSGHLTTRSSRPLCRGDALSSSLLIPPTLVKTTPTSAHLDLQHRHLLPPSPFLATVTPPALSRSQLRHAPLPHKRSCMAISTGLVRCTKRVHSTLSPARTVPIWRVLLCAQKAETGCIHLAQTRADVDKRFLNLDDFLKGPGGQ